MNINLTKTEILTIIHHLDIELDEIEKDIDIDKCEEFIREKKFYKKLIKKLVVK